MNFEIAALDPDGIEDVAKLFHRLWHQTQAGLQDQRLARHRDLGFFRQRISGRAERTIVAKFDSSIIGFATWTNGILNSLFVDGAHQGKGIGSALCVAAERKMAQAGAASFKLYCIFGNEAACNFYKKLGWRIVRIDTLLNETPEGTCRTKVWIMVKP